VTPQQQERLFKIVRERYKGWDIKQVSGYVHGVADGLKRTEPRQVYIRGFKKNKPYARGYIYGFIDAYGVDALIAEWGRELNLSGANIVYRWWENAE
jgi:hypothetical protein